MAQTAPSKKDSNARVEVIGSDVVVDDSHSAVDIDDRRYSRLGWLLVLLGFGGFMLWAALAPLDQGVPAPGKVMVSGNRQAVQNLVGGVVNEILVRDGQEVKKGQVLVRMDDTQPRSQAETLRGQFYSQLAAEARLRAERDGSAMVIFPPELMQARDDPRAAMAMALQQQLFEARRMALESELRAVDQTLMGLRADLSGLKSLRDARSQEAQFLRDQLAGIRDLSREGYIARNRLLELEGTYSRISGDLAQIIANIRSTESRIAELQVRKEQRLQEFQRDVRSELSTTQREVESLRSRIEYADYELMHTQVRSPADGVVVGLNVFTDGGVVQPGTHLMDIVPLNEPLVVEAQVPIHLIDKVVPGLPVEMMFTAFNQRTTPHIPGKVTNVSADRLENPQTREPYYRIEAEVTPEGEKLLAEHSVRPGMPVDVLIKTGERSLLNYLLRPIIDRARTALVQE